MYISQLTKKILNSEKKNFCTFDSLLQIVQQSRFYQKKCFGIFLVVIKNVHLKPIVENGIYSFSIKNPIFAIFIVKQISEFLT